MYYIAKLAQACGLTILIIEFMRKFPQLMDMRVFGAGILLFVFGWIILTFLVKRG